MISALTFENPAIMEREAHKVLEELFNARDLPKVHVPGPDQPFKQTADSRFHAFPEIFIQLSGMNHFRCGDETFTLNTGEICIMPAGVPHAETGEGDSFANIVIVHDTDRFIALGCHHWYEHLGVIPIKSCTTDKAKHLSDLLTETADSFNHSSPVAPHLFRAYIGLMLERYKQSLPEPKPGICPLVARCMDLLFAELGSADLSIARIARQLSCNADSLSARFSREVGKTAIEYLTELRLEKAKKLLKETSMPVAEVAWASGYRDPNYFSRLFKRKTGLSPLHYRNANP